MTQPPVSSDAAPRQRVLVWGLADFGKPRTRILIQGLQADPSIALDYAVIDLWKQVEDKSRLTLLQAAAFALRALLAYPRLIVMFLRAPKPDLVFVPYLGVFDVLVLRAFACIRGVNILWDAFLPLYDTVIEDRKLVKPGGAAAWFLSAVEGLAARSARLIILDTKAHADHFSKAYPQAANKTRAVLVGAETTVFTASAEPDPAPNPALDPSPARAFTVLFYGQCIPLHGIRHILAAAERTASDPALHWRLIGEGQDEALIEAAMSANPANLSWERWVPYEDLPKEIAAAHLCLGVFGDSEKAARVIPNKIFQYTAMSKPFVTRDGPAIRELFKSSDPGVWLVEAASASAIVNAVYDARDALQHGADLTLHATARKKIEPAAIGAAFSALTREAA